MEPNVRVCLHLCRSEDRSVFALCVEDVGNMRDSLGDGVLYVK